MRFDSRSSQLVEGGLDAMWLKMRIGMNNISNYETPGFKAQKLDFSQVLQEMQCDSPLHGGTQPTEPSYVATVYADEETEARVDGNNVSMEREQIELWRTQQQYTALTQKITGHYDNLRKVITQFGK